LRYPLYSLASQWGASVDVTHTDSVVRYFSGTELLTYDSKLTPDDDKLPYIYRQRRTAVDSRLTRSLGADVIQRFSVGHLFDSRRYAVLPDFRDPALADDFVQHVAPISEQRSEPYLRYELFTPRYMILRDMDTFDLRENLQLGPHLVARVSYGLPALGADRAALGLSATASYAISPGGGYARLWLSASTRLFDGQFHDQLASEQLFVATPLILRAFRIVVEGEASSVQNDTQNTHFFLGGTLGTVTSVERGGLRAYGVNEIHKIVAADGTVTNTATSMLLGHVEARSQSLHIFSQRFGALLFYDVGGLGSSYGALATYHDAGLGLRWLIPQLNSAVVRIYWAVPFTNGPLTRAGLPGLITAGFDQMFQLF